MVTAMWMTILKGNSLAFLVVDAMIPQAHGKRQFTILGISYATDIRLTGRWPDIETVILDKEQSQHGFYEVIVGFSSWSPV
jgi:hypothetical protein